MNAIKAKRRVNETGEVIIYAYRPDNARMTYYTLAASHEPCDWIGGQYKTIEKAESAARRIFNDARIVACR